MERDKGQQMACPAVLGGGKSGGCKGSNGNDGSDGNEEESTLFVLFFMIGFAYVE
jgi:hypothetical protein